MNNTDMETFWAVLEHGTLTAAAEALFITQPTLTNRNTNGHTVSVRGMGSNRYRVVIVNMSNKPIAGSGGVLLNFPMTVPTGLALPTVVIPSSARRAPTSK